eukprot:GHRQ01027293.1.p3 GENE.GHRQ01027293.1~~GHRQ01027293.1.p3  ORF type:complete len:101 (+),score=25.36 GHRQ01027293.1:593-895(+)
MPALQVSKDRHKPCKQGRAFPARAGDAQMPPKGSAGVVSSLPRQLSQPSPHLRGNGQAKVSQLQVAAAGYEQVFQLDVPAGQHSTHAAKNMAAGLTDNIR